MRYLEKRVHLSVYRTAESILKHHLPGTDVACCRDLPRRFVIQDLFQSPEVAVAEVVAAVCYTDFALKLLVVVEQPVEADGKICKPGAVLAQEFSDQLPLKLIFKVAFIIFTPR